MAFSFQSRTVGDDITVVKCSGRIVEGRSAALRHHVDDVFKNTPATTRSSQLLQSTAA